MLPCLWRRISIAVVNANRKREMLAPDPLPLPDEEEGRRSINGAVGNVLDSSDWTTGALISMVNGAEGIWMASNMAVTKSTWIW